VPEDPPENGLLEENLFAASASSVVDLLAGVHNVSWSQVRVSFFFSFHSGGKGNDRRIFHIGSC
jgi:hypothetical protein